MCQGVGGGVDRSSVRGHRTDRKPAEIKVSAGPLPLVFILTSLPHFSAFTFSTSLSISLPSSSLLLSNTLPSHTLLSLTLPSHSLLTPTLPSNTIPSHTLQHPSILSLLPDCRPLHTLPSYTLSSYTLPSHTLPSNTLPSHTLQRPPLLFLLHHYCFLIMILLIPSALLPCSQPLPFSYSIVLSHNLLSPCPSPFPLPRGKRVRGFSSRPRRSSICSFPFLSISLSLSLPLSPPLISLFLSHLSPSQALSFYALSPILHTFQLIFLLPPPGLALSIFILLFFRLQLPLLCV